MTPRKLPLCSIAEREAVTTSERSDWCAARIRSEALLAYIQRLHDYLHGSGPDPSVVNNVNDLANEVGAYISSALGARYATRQLAKRRPAKKAKKRK